MLGARAVVLALGRGGAEWEIAALSRPGATLGAARSASSGEGSWRAGGCAVVGAPIWRRFELLGRELVEALGWRDLILVRLTESEGELLGVLCLVDLGRELSATECQLLEALASHASVALENVRLFSRVERSRKQWVEDFDAISDFIVVHDQRGASCG